MGVEVSPEFNPRVPELVQEAEGKTLAQNLLRIQSFSKKSGIRSITDFLDNRDLPDDVDDFESWAESRTDWYTADEGLQAVESLLKAIRSDAKAAQRWNKGDPDGLETLLFDLDDLARCLRKAVSRGVKFRLGAG